MKLTPQLRRIIYIAVVLVGLVLAALNLIKAEDAESIITVVGLLLGSTGGALAAAKIGEAPDAKTTNQRILEAVDYASGQILASVQRRANVRHDEAVTERIPVAQPAPANDFAVKPRTHL